MKGKVVRWLGDFGYGFIKPDDGGRDVFVHGWQFRSANLPTPHEGDRLEFEIGEGRDGRPQATNIKAVA